MSVIVFFIVTVGNVIVNLLHSLFFFSEKKPGYPPSKYTTQQAVADGEKHFKTALQMASANRVLQISTCGKAILTLIHALMAVPLVVLTPLIQTVSEELMECAGTKAAISARDRELLWTRFHLYGIKDSVMDKWNAVFVTLNLNRVRKAEVILVQMLLKNWLQIIISTRNNTDFPPVQEDIVCDSIGEKEQAVIHYVAGYVAFKLKRFYARFPNSEKAQQTLRIILNWHVPRDVNDWASSGFLAFSRLWTDKVDRGGLFRVSDKVFCFFRQLEEKSRPYVNKNYLKVNHNVNLRYILTQKLVNSQPIRKAWKAIVNNDTQLSNRLLNKVVDEYVNIRIGAYVKAVAYANREKVSKKRQKALRASLTD